MSTPRDPAGPDVYYVRVGADSLRVEVTPGQDHATVEIGAQRYEIRGQVRPGEALQSLSVNGRTVDFKLEQKNGRLVLSRRGNAVHTRALSALEHQLYAVIPERAPPETGHLVPSPMAGKIVAVPVAVGDSVKAGQTLCIIEAMKMENALQAEHDGVLAAVHVATGTAVEADQLLMEFARPGAPA